MARTRNPAQRRYVWRIAGATGAYLGTLAAALHLVGDGRVTGPLAYVLALLPALSVAGMFWAMGRLLVEEQDEYQRMLLVRQSLVATGFALTVATMWGFLENFDLVPHVDAFYLAVLWFFGLGLGSVFNRFTVGDSGGCRS
ncbi:MAG: hypothetical protein WBR13_08180 [Allosphingosinicella sp.]